LSELSDGAHRLDRAIDIHHVSPSTVDTCFKLKAFMSDATTLATCAETCSEVDSLRRLVTFLFVFRRSSVKDVLLV
jgi:hypothetical protein